MATRTTSTSSTAFMEGCEYQGSITGLIMSDGSILYNHAYTPEFNDVLCDGNSMRDLIIEEVRIWPDGYGYVLVERLNPSDGVRYYHSGFPVNYVFSGNIQII